VVVPSARQPELVVGTARFGPATSCLQSQIGRHHYQGKAKTAQFMATVLLSVSVRSVPIVTRVNGTLVARRRQTSTGREAEAVDGAASRPGRSAGAARTGRRSR
jgi:hypothetical protein